MRYLSVEDVLRVNEVEAGPNLLADRALLEAAVARPQQSAGGEDAYPDLHSKAAALLHSLLMNHPFVDGNKRTAVIAVGLFYGLNGWWLEGSQEDIVTLALDVIEGRLLGIEDIVARLKELAHPLPIPED